jgi:NTE family protein
MATVKVALALGGGAARGWAHIGVIRALQEMDITIDIVAGTSIGSLVGAGFASGKLDELESWVRNMDRWQVIRLLDIGFNRGALIHGDKVFDHARDLLGKVSIEDLPMCFAAVATDLHSGREVWLRDGDVYDAARASCAVPGLLAASLHNERWLVDGGLVNPVPVSLCRALGGELVIAVNLNDQQSTQVNINEQPGLLSVVAASIDIMQDRITRARLAGDPPNILIQPKLGGIGLLEFERGKEAIDIGYKATMRMKEQIQHELDSL